MKKILDEFKEFISRGNVLDMAVGIIIGGAFTNVVSSLVKDIINPFLGLFGGMNFDRLSWNIVGDVTLNYGSFLTTILNFLIMAFVVFLIVKVMNTVSDRFARKKEEEDVAPTTKICPFCKSEIDIDASRCPHCTSELEK
ncbi:MAG: large conductance mechanosensitive channel protein MscL [Eubacterium sp.]|nr:large conductance mechanosensitive channel protein MscL [Eubacterium sp.]